MIFLLLMLSICSSASFGQSNSSSALQLEFPGISRKLKVSFEKSVCGTNGKRPYETVVSEPGKSYRLVCKVREAGFNYDSEVPVTVIDNFDYPRQVFADMEKYWEPNRNYPTTRSIKIKNTPWGKQYEWETPTTGSAKYSYLCPSKSDSCIRVVSGGIEILSFKLEPIKKVKSSRQ